MSESHCLNHYLIYTKKWRRFSLSEFMLVWFSELHIVFRLSRRFMFSPSLFTSSSNVSKQMKSICWIISQILSIYFLLLLSIPNWKQSTKKSNFTLMLTFTIPYSMFLIWVCLWVNFRASLKYSNKFFMMFKEELRILSWFSETLSTVFSYLILFDACSKICSSSLFKTIIKDSSVLERIIGKSSSLIFYSRLW